MLRKFLTLLIIFMLSSGLQADPVDDPGLTEIRRLLDNKRYPEARELARNRLAERRASLGNESVELAEPLTTLADIEAYLGNYQIARERCNESIALIERYKGRLAADLVQPLEVLAATYFKTGQYEASKAILLRALQVTHANQGFYNLDQLPARDALTETYVMLSDLESADFHQRAQVEILSYKHGFESVETAAGYFKLAEWYSRTGNTLLEIDNYRRGYKLLQRAIGENNPDLIEALRNIANSYVMHPEANGESLMKSNPNAEIFAEPDAETINVQQMRVNAVKALQQAISINSKQETPDPRLEAELLVELGDAQTLFGKTTSASKAYRQAWAVMAELPDGEELQQETFGQPNLIGLIPMPNYYPLRQSTERNFAADPTAFGSGYAVFSFDVSKSGSVKNIELLQADPPKTVERKAARVLRYARYRPILREGNPVRATDQRYNLEFKYALNSIIDNTEDDTDDFEPLPNPNLP